MFELSCPRRQDALPAWPMMNKHGYAGKVACRSASALERGVRPHQGTETLEALEDEQAT